jgi:hypothetical protein
MRFANTWTKFQLLFINHYFNDVCKHWRNHYSTDWVWQICNVDQCKAFWTRLLIRTFQQPYKMTVIQFVNTTGTETAKLTRRTKKLRTIITGHHAASCAKPEFEIDVTRNSQAGWIAKASKEREWDTHVRNKRTNRFFIRTNECDPTLCTIRRYNTLWYEMTWWHVNHNTLCEGEWRNEKKHASLGPMVRGQDEVTDRARCQHEGRCRGKEARESSNGGDP